MKRGSAGLWAAAGTAAVVLGLTAYMVLAGGDGGDDAAGGGASPGPSVSVSLPSTPGPTYTIPADWTEPDRWAVLPTGTGTDIHGNPTGFEHTTEGALAVLAAANSTEVEGSRSLADEQLANYYSYMADASRSEEAEEALTETSNSADEQARERMGVSTNGNLPDGAYMRSVTVGFKVVVKSADQVGAWLLSRYTVKAGTAAEEHVTYARTLLAVSWEDGDGWRISGPAMTAAEKAAEEQSKPEIVAVGDEAFNDAGWTAIREAS